MTMNPDIIRRILPVSTLLLDVDGVLTDGSIVYSDSGDEIKSFNAKDGLGLRLLMDAGITVGIVTGRRSQALQKRCDNLGITLVFDGVTDKKQVLEQFILENGLSPDAIAFAGDDLPDIRIMKSVGFPIAVADAAPLVKETALYVTSSPGGHGAVREICELILKTKGLWDTIMERFI
ncbi:MAG: HAD hydrolase family protein [Desulfobacteraceae bacterium]|jgi:3-deoxy-D-manno-octulosonate 8-phosphate phosphatase (KDO 8-P phosphatase)